MCSELCQDPVQVLLTESPMNPTKKREKMVEVRQY